MTLSELIQKLEQATEGSDALDREIAKACDIEWSSDEDGNYGPYNITPNRIRFTRSLDAALTLVPDGLFWYVQAPGSYQRQPGDPYEACAYVNRHGFADSGPYWQATGTTPALALCIAALKARVSPA